MIVGYRDSPDFDLRSQFGYSREDGCAFRANSEAERAVLNVAAGVYFTGVREQRGPDAKF